MTHFFKNGQIFSVAPAEAIDIRKELPVGTYIVGATLEGFYLEITDPFEINFKLYGSILSNSKRILNTYQDRSSSTGVLLAGEKGSGKTLLAKQLSIQGAKDFGMITLIVTKPFGGDGFNTLLQNIEQPCIVLFDEFEKVYDKDQQKEILTLLDGIVTTKKLFVFTVNDHWKIDDHMKNRPGRIYYLLDHEGLEEDFIREFATDNLKNQGHVDLLCRTLILFDKFNFDMLKSLVQEMNRYDESPQDAMRFLNIRPSLIKVKYKVTTTWEGIDCSNSWGDFAGDPLTYTDIISVYKPNKKGKKENSPSEEQEIIFSPDRISKMDARTGTFVYEYPEQKIVLTFTKVKMGTFNYYDYDF